MDRIKLKELLPDELRHFMARAKEKHYTLIDVRQPQEYAVAHIPGAMLLPLMELEAQLFDLPDDRALVFYCHSGARSEIAAACPCGEPIPGSARRRSGTMLPAGIVMATGWNRTAKKEVRLPSARLSWP